MRTHTNMNAKMNPKMNANMYTSCIYNAVITIISVRRNYKKKMQKMSNVLKCQFNKFYNNYLI